MIIPKDIVEFLDRNPDTRERFGFVSTLRGTHVRPYGFPSVGTELEAWMVEEGYRRSPAIARYVFYLGFLSRVYSAIYNRFETWDPSGRQGHDCLTLGTRIDELLAIARYLYYLDSHGVEGSLLECGSFKGWSSICLSWACDYLGRKLYVADSFEGLPPPGERNWSGYEAGDFAGGLDEVQRNVYAFGRLRSTEFIKGWFSESLKGFDEPVALLWIDVDLYESAADVMRHAYPCLSREGTILVHEYDQLSAEEPFGPPTAVVEYLDENKVPYRTKLAVPDTLGLVVPHVDGELLFSPKKHSFWYDRSLGDADRAAQYALLVDQNKLQARLDELLNSRSWQVTAPLRRASDIALKLFHKLRG